MARFTRRQLIAATPALALGAVIALPAAVRADQPHMDAALDHLKAAQKELEAATADKGGHRGNALRLVREAMAEVEKGIGFARKH